jgi:hypothetical protein
VDFDTDDVGEFKKLAEFRTNVVQVPQQAISPDLGFATEHHVFGKREVIVQICLLGSGLPDELFQHGLGRVQVAGLELEVRVDTDDFLGINHR